MKKNIPLLLILFLTSIPFADLSLGLRGGINFGWITKNRNGWTDRSLNAGGSTSFNVQHYLNNHFLISYYADYSVFKPTFNGQIYISFIPGSPFETKDVVKSQAITIGINPTLFFLKDNPKVNLGLGIGVGALIRLKTEIYEYIDGDLENQYEVAHEDINEVNIPISMNWIIKINVTEKIYLTIDNILSWGTLKLESPFDYMDYYTAGEKERYYKCMLGINFNL